MLMNLAFLPQLMGGEKDQGRSDFGPAQGARADRYTAQDEQKNGVREPPASSGSPSEGAPANRDWSGFLRFVGSSHNKVLPNLHMVQGQRNGDRLELSCPGYMAQRLQDQTKMAWLKERVREYFGTSMHIQICQMGGENGRDEQELKKKILSEPAVQEAITRFSARVVKVQPAQPEDKA
jgi:hypothetical protein